MSDTQYDESGAGRYLGGNERPIPPRTLQRWRQEGTGPAFLKIGRLIRYRQRDLDDFLDRSVRASTSEVA